MEKPRTKEEGQKLISKIINETANGCRHRAQKIALWQKQFASLPEDVRNETIATLTAGLKVGTITISNAAAGSFPYNRSEIIGLCEDISIFSEAINSMKDDVHALEVLSDKIVTCMGDRICTISGGIDYSDPYIQDLLQLSEVGTSALELEKEPVGIDHYRGISKTALIKLIAQAKTN